MLKLSSQATRLVASSSRISMAIFDLAGTVVDWGSCAPVDAFQAIFEEAGVPATEAEAREPMGAAKRDHIKAMLAQPRISAEWERVKGRQAQESDVDALYDAFTPRQIEAVRDEARAALIPGALDAVEAIRAQGGAVGGCTGYNRPVMDAVVQELTKRGFRADDYECAADDGWNGRPSPWMSVELAKRTRTAYPLHTCLKVDDTPTGISEGLNAGMWTVGVCHSGNNTPYATHKDFLADGDAEATLDTLGKPFQEAGANYVISGVWDLPTVLEDIAARLRDGQTPLSGPE